MRMECEDEKMKCEEWEDGLLGWSERMECTDGMKA